MEFLEALRASFRTLNAHRLRSILTTLGIIIGIGAVLMNVAMVEGFSAMFEEEVKGLGANFVSVRAGENQYFDEHIYDTVSGGVNLESATASRNSNGTVEYTGEKKALPIFGVKPGYFEARDLNILRGLALGHQSGSTLVISREVAEKKFEKPILVSSTVKVTIRKSSRGKVTRKFKVQGVCENPSGFSGMTAGVYLPISTFNDMNGSEGYTSISLFAKSDDYIDTVETETVDSLDSLLKIEPGRSIKRGGEGQEGGGGGPMGGGSPRSLREATTEEEEEYSIQTQEDVLGFVENISGTIRLLFVGIASVSLLVGAIGIANIMIVSVTERTREIGIRKAVGAKNKDILTLFLLEAGTIGLLGGGIGLGLGSLLSKIIVPAMVGVEGIIPLEWVGLSVGISFLIGVISGLYPAFRAAKMDPVEALTYE